MGNQEQIAHGQSESPLNDRGIEQALSAAAMLTRWHGQYHRVYTSPFSRAYDTGKHISDALQIPIHVLRVLPYMIPFLKLSAWFRSAFGRR